MFFFLVAANLTVYLSSLQLLANHHMLAGGATFIGGILLTLFSKVTHNAKKKSKRLRDRLDCDCPDCGDCDCGCD
jgi:hypothetical protein